MKDCMAKFIFEQWRLGAIKNNCSEAEKNKITAKLTENYAHSVLILFLVIQYLLSLVKIPKINKK